MANQRRRSRRRQHRYTAPMHEIELSHEQRRGAHQKDKVDRAQNIVSYQAAHDPQSSSHDTSKDKQKRTAAEAFNGPEGYGCGQNIHKCGDKTDQERIRDGTLIV